MERINYWKECIANAAEEVELSLTPEQEDHLAEAVQSFHDNYGLAFYSPPDSDRINEIENEWKTKYKNLEKEMERNQDNAETAIKRALRVHSSDQVTIGEYGEVHKVDGRFTRIQ